MLRILADTCQIKVAVTPYSTGWIVQLYQGDQIIDEATTRYNGACIFYPAGTFPQRYSVVLPQQYMNGIEYGRASSGEFQVNKADEIKSIALDMVPLVAIPDQDVVPEPQPEPMFPLLNELISWLRNRFT